MEQLASWSQPSPALPIQQKPHPTNVKVNGAEAALSVSTNTAINLLTKMGIPITSPLRGNAFLLEDALRNASHPPKIKSSYFTYALKKPA